MKYLYRENKSIINKIPDNFNKRKQELKTINKKIKATYSF